ncbi:MAG: winged helix-turn-helix transcriptional regulator [Gammaproteobacteria bacterium]|nr:winged helix-turn-helix transcriptional regulator [Gammaproteobacteria bacterium]
MGDTSKSLNQLIYESRLFYQSLLAIDEQIKAETGLTLRMRTILEYLLRFGPSTVPNIARSNSVPDQRIQSQVNQLVKKSLVKVQGNPASKLSPLTVLLPEGLKAITEMKAREAGIFAKLNLTDLQYRDATQALRDLREAVEREVYKQP